MVGAPAPLTAAELAALDAAYVPFPSLEEWPQEILREVVWARRVDDLSELVEGADASAVTEATDVAVRAAAWDTGAIEGLYPTTRGITMTIAEQAAEWEEEIASHGAEAEALFDAALATYELVLDVATRRQPITHARIRRIHEELTGPQETYEVHTPSGVHQEPLPRGQYKTNPNHVELPDGSRHAYAPVSDTQAEMTRLVDELSSEAFGAAPPVVQAAYAHYAVVAIHPFADGNGRVARALASIYLYRAARIPLIIFADDRDAYLDALATADRGDPRAFVEHIADAAIASVELVIDALKTRAAPTPSAEIEALRDLITVQGGLTFTDLDSTAITLLTSHFPRVAAEEIGKLDPPNGVQVSLSSGSGASQQAPDGYRPVVANPGQYAMINFGSQPPSAAGRSATFMVFVSQSRDEDIDLFWCAKLGTDEGVKFSLRDLHPRLTAAAEHRLRMLIQRVIGTELAELLAEARFALEASGYISQNP